MAQGVAGVGGGSLLVGRLAEAAEVAVPFAAGAAEGLAVSAAGAGAPAHVRLPAVAGLVGATQPEVGLAVSLGASARDAEAAAVPADGTRPPVAEKDGEGASVQHSGVEAGTAAALDVACAERWRACALAEEVAVVAAVAEPNWEVRRALRP